ncbi:MAG: hypothetical protein V2G43_07625 [bacterium JZ-2024 1]
MFVTPLFVPLSLLEEGIKGRLVWIHSSETPSFGAFLERRGEGVK